PHEDETTPAYKNKSRRSLLITSGMFLLIAIISYISFGRGMGNFIVFVWLFYLLNHFVLSKVIKNFQDKLWPKFQNFYAGFLTWCLKGWRPVFILLGTILLLFISFAVTAIRQPKVVFFPQAEPNFVYVYMRLPAGTDQAHTDSLTKVVEDRVYGVLGTNNPIVESVISNVAVGATDPNEGDRSIASNKAKVSVSFVEFSHRQGKSTSEYLTKIREAVKGIAGVEISVDQEASGPPVGKPVNIEIAGEDLTQLIATSKGLKRYLDSLQIKGVEELKSDIDDKKPEIVINIDRERANREGISTAQIGMEIRNAVFGKEVSKYKEGNDEYPIQLRFLPSQRSNINELLNLKISYRDMVMMGQIRQIPLSAIADVKYETTYGGIKRKNQKRVITLGSNILSNYNANEVVAAVKDAVDSYPKPDGITFDMTGEQEQQMETMSFLGNAMLISLGLILLILVTQFNSISKPLLILTEIVFSIIGVLLGFSIFNISISIVMTGIGVVALAGIVVRNGILLVEFTDILLERGYKLQDAIVEAGRTRMTPVILTASATIMGLVPLAIGLNIDFVELFTNFDPKLFFGGDSVAFWGPLSWTMIFGLAFATFLTLILVPIMYLLNEKLQMWFYKKLGHSYSPEAAMQAKAAKQESQDTEDTAITF
nr:efflux RND transporter permease subunit [Saprospiraceae bacterium]